MNFIVPNKSKVNFPGQIYVENTPINMDKIITFERDAFRGVRVIEESEETNDDLIGAGNNMPTGGSINNSVASTTYLVGEGRPAITFKHGDDDDDIIQWCFMTKPDRDSHYDQLVEFISKASKMVVNPK
jgi:hypothetical protein